MAESTAPYASPYPFHDKPNPFQQIETDIQQLVKAVNRVAEILQALPVTPPPTVTGSRGGNAALGNLLTALAASGLIVNGTTP